MLRQAWHGRLSTGRQSGRRPYRHPYRPPIGGRKVAPYGRVRSPSTRRLVPPSAGIPAIVPALAFKLKLAFDRSLAFNRTEENMHETNIQHPPVDRDDVRFFAEHGSQRVGYAWTDALAMARAEKALIASGATVVWENDNDADASFVDTWDEADRKRWNMTNHLAESATLILPCYDRHHGGHGSLTCDHAETLASLHGIFDADDDYRRVIEAELALEAYDRLIES